ncbi:putative tRNA methyltransferase 9B [Mixophyes fleayi]|uniref:putative tRNA methyltransferase 9B n=1 Tax=Mixophyes fleayi TaxID=3061075 RepID=UPI003F4E04D9
MEKEANYLEKKHVHNVYEKIAPYFNDKRYKAWPNVQEFLLAQEPGSLIADVGCGNGKYLHINSQAFKVGCDYSISLAEAARNQGYEIIVCDGLQLPYRDGCFDAVLSIAVIHHFSTKERRIRAIKEMARILRVGGQMMIYVWAMEQERRKFEKQDLLIPWNMETSSQNISEKLESSMEPDFENLLLNKSFSKIDTPIKQRTKSSSFVGETLSSLQKGLNSSRFLARSLDSGLDVKCGGSDQKHHSILGRLYDYCTEMKNCTNTLPSKPSHFLRSFGDFLPKYLQNLETNTNKVTELLAFPLANIKCPKSSNAESTNVTIKDFSKVPLPDLVSTGNDSTDLKHCITLKYAEPCENSGENKKEGSCLISDSDYKKVSQYHQQGENNGWLRYYHIFKQGELRDLIEHYVPELHVVQTFFDHSNWCVIVQKNQLWKI